MTHHGEGLRRLSGDADLVAALKRDWRTADLAGVDAALCELAEALTRRPASVEGSRIEALKRLGLDDRAIFDAVHVIAYYNYVNRLAEGLGVELESCWEGHDHPDEFSSASTDLPEE